MKYSLCLPIFLTAIIFSCSKKTVDTPVVTVPERLTIAPINKSVQTGDTAIFRAVYFNTLGQETSLPANAVWSSSNNAVATITQAGVATGVSTGQVEIKVQFNTTIATALLSVVVNAAQIATITLASEVELNLNGVQTLTAVAKNINGIVLPGKTFTWQSNNNAIVSVDANTGQVTGKTYGTAAITASAEGLVSNPSMVQVIRSGNFAGQGSAGTGKLKLIGGLLKLETSANFLVSGGAPDLRIYLSNSSGNIATSVEVATLNLRTGAQSWTVPAGTTITQYKYLLVWCKQFGGAYGVAELSN